VELHTLWEGYQLCGQDLNSPGECPAQDREPQLPEPTRKVTQADIDGRQVGFQQQDTRRFLRQATLPPSPVSIMLSLGAILAQLDIRTVRGALQGGMI
jgi:hypothetical protein